MARNTQKTPQDGDEGDDNAFQVKFGPFSLDAKGRFLDRPGAIFGLALIFVSVVAVIVLLGDRIWKLFT